MGQPRAAAAAVSTTGRHPGGPGQRLLPAHRKITEEFGHARTDADEVSTGNDRWPDRHGEDRGEMHHDDGGLLQVRQRAHPARAAAAARIARLKATTTSQEDREVHVVADGVIQCAAPMPG